VHYPNGSGQVSCPAGRSDSLLVVLDGGFSVSYIPSARARGLTHNSLIVIAPYWFEGTWVFDDDQVGLHREPFVTGVPEIINELVKDIPDAKRGFRLTCSETAFPGFQRKLTWVRAENGGNSIAWINQNWKAGFAPPCSGTSTTRLRSSMSGQIRKGCKKQSADRSTCRPRGIRPIHVFGPAAASEHQMPRVSAGLLVYRRRESVLEVLLVHPGGPFWKNKDAGAWSIPKGEIGVGEDPLAAARREFWEETGHAPSGDFVPLKPVKQRSGKLVHAWAVEADLDPDSFKSNTFEMEWPPKSGKQVEFPEVDRAGYFDLKTAAQKINPAQSAFLTELEKNLRS
jgi:predicted NUDIX family NTP pyrophosphohydrolase